MVRPPIPILEFKMFVRGPAAGSECEERASPDRRGMGAQVSAIDQHSQPTSVDIVVVGAGFAGLYLVHKLRGLGYDILGLEAGDDVGGTWYWNRYPGARCDVESLQYSYSFSDELQAEWKWSERFAPQSEILSYLRHVADRFDLRRSFRFDTRVASATFDETRDRWNVVTESGAAIDARFCIMATGCLSVPTLPSIPGIEAFEGEVLHTARWPDEGFDFGGMRVGLIGTGSSAVQSIPPIAEQAERLFVFQRTPNFSVPARNQILGNDYVAEWKADYGARRAQARTSRSGVLYEYGTQSALDVAAPDREKELQRRWEVGGTNFLYAFTDTLRHPEANRVSADFVRSRIRDIVKDPATAEKLIPTDYPIGTKRICVDTDYYETFNRENVTLVDVRAAPIETITAEGVRTADGDYALDALVLATGFDAMTGALLAIDIRGRDGQSLRDKWNAGPRTLLGLAMAGFPNLFIVTGPGSPSVLSNMVIAIEQHVEWISDCITWMDAEGATRIEARAEAEDAWVEEVNAAAAPTLYSEANSWFLGANIPGKPRVFMPYVGGFHIYSQKCADMAAAGYPGFLVGGRTAGAISGERRRAPATADGSGRDSSA